MIAALATAGALLDRSDWINLAIRTYKQIIALMSVNSRLAHSYRGGKSVFPGLATDYAATVKAALSLFSATQDRSYLADAERFTGIVRTHHWDSENSGYYLSADDADALIIRPRSNVDEATPSANATMGANLARLWRLTGDDKYRRDLDDMLHAAAGTATANIFATAATLNALDLRLNAIDIVVTRPPLADAGPALSEIRRHWSPNAILSLHDGTATFPDTHPAARKTPVDGKVTVYICRGETCSLPITELEQLAVLL